MFRHASRSVEQLIFAVSLGEPRSFHIAVFVLFGGIALRHLGSAESLFGHIQLSESAAVRNHIFVEFQVVALRISPHKPSLIVVVDKHGGVDVVPTSVFKKGFADSVLETLCGIVGYSHAYCHSARNLRMGADVPIELAVAVDGLRSPRAVVCPRECLQSQGRTVVGVVDHIGGGINAPFLHPKEIGVVLVVTRVNVERVVVHHRRGVGCKPSLNHRVLGG